MHSGPSVVVHKGGFLASVARGFFTLLTVLVICVSGLAGAGLWLVNRHMDRFASVGTEVLRLLPDWQAALPPALADAVHDRRAPEYREQLQLTARVIPGDSSDEPKLMLEVVNRGPQTVTMLAARVDFERDGVPVHTRLEYVITPLAIDKAEWPGPLLPGETRRIVRRLKSADPGASLRIETCELRVWSPDATAEKGTS